MLLFSHLTEVREFCSAAGAVWGPRLPWGVGQRGYSLLEENTPFKSPREGRGAPPSTPHIGSFYLEELHTLRNVSAVYMASP